MKLRIQNNNVLNAEDKFGQSRESVSTSVDLEELGELAIQVLNDKNLEVSKVKPFFWTMVEAYADRFQKYPFDIPRAMISYLELKDYPEDLTLELVNRLEAEFEKAHGRPLRKSKQQACQPDELDDEIKALRDTIKYAALVAENKD